MDFEIMREMHWSWDQLQRTPPYVRRYTWDLIGLRLQAEKQARERAEREARARHGR